ncbi:hypothetical protein HBA55_32885 [Pseudomaricurvus alkylphenolicus]|uniref:hypothetical protein n=1 Tax=Pseudomaricurvus alkylphenolicus TaxID=1306991 RepID=UPI00141E2B8F|nr:hypothetical protein [Pseudomaricurvus alkylphenolicus]NIB44431.1 hypothetical protein [Pseudomaricurvus alkylphenolicus]
MNTESLTLAWGAYLAGALGLMIVWWHMTAAVKRDWLRPLLRVFMAALLLCPYSIGEDYTQMAPAILMVLMETIFEGGEAFNRVGPTLLGVVGAALVVTVVCQLIWRQRRRKAEQDRQLQQAHDSLVKEAHTQP